MKRFLIVIPHMKNSGTESIVPVEPELGSDSKPEINLESIIIFKLDFSNQKYCLMIMLYY
jgi:hypothetical protein